MGAVKAHTWKELVDQTAIAEKLAKKFEPSIPKGKWGMNNKGRNEMTVFPSQRNHGVVGGNFSKNQESWRQQSGVKFPLK